MCWMTMNSHGVKAPDFYHSTMALTLFTLNYTHLELMLGTNKLPAVRNTSSNPKNKMLKSLAKFFIMFTCILICEVFAEATSIIIPYHLMFNYNHKMSASFWSFFQFLSFFTAYCILPAHLLFTANFSSVRTRGGYKDLQSGKSH